MEDKVEQTKPPEAATGDAAPTSGEPPPLPPTAEALASKARDLQALRDAVVDAASVGAGLWFSYLFVLFYLLIAVGAVTHRDLLLESPVKLPFLNVELPLLGFFWLGPAIFLVVHAYVLLHFVLLAGKVGDFDTELTKKIPDDDIQNRLRRQLPSNIFVQFLAGSDEVRTGRVGILLQLIAWISLVLGPIALLVFFELQFLPYHNEAITWWHRIAVVVDIVFLWILWPSIARGERAGLSWHDLRHGKIMALAFASLAPVLLVTTIATFPGEWLEENLPSVQFVPWKDQKDPQQPPKWRLASLHELLVAGEVDFAARKPKSFWSNRLVLPGFDAIDHTKFDSEAKIEAASETISLRARHLEGAVLIGATLRKADFTGVQLQGAQFDQADLREAKFDCGNALRYPPQQCPHLQGASLNGAQLQGASLNHVQLQGASLFVVQLQGALLFRAQLQGATLIYARLQGASLDQAQLQGALLFRAQLQGASLTEAQLQGASLSAQLQGASLELAQLQGASLAEAQLQGASLSYVSAWRADARSAAWEETRVVNPETGPMSVESFGELKQLIGEQVPEGDKGRDAMNWIAQSLDPTKALEGEDEMAKVWQSQAGSSPTPDVYENRLAGILRETGCAADGAPYVLRGLLANLDNRFGAQSPQPSALAKAFLDEEHCPGAHGLTDAEKAKLKEIRDRSTSPAPKP
jgi:uncharacterized protein YjbI with pentapeptide repeats